MRDGATPAHARFALVAFRCRHRFAGKCLGEDFLFELAKDVGVAEFRMRCVGPVQVGQGITAQRVSKMGNRIPAVTRRSEKQSCIDINRAVQAGSGFTPPLLGVPAEAWIECDIGIEQIRLHEQGFDRKQSGQ